MSRSDWLNLAQKVFNTYIRLRDRDKPCISCNKPLNTKYDAGHYYSMGNYSFLRFNEENTHAQCVHCNRDLHGNLLEYRINLIKRIGIERVEILDESRHNKLDISIESVQLLIKKYKLKIKEHESKRI